MSPGSTRPPGNTQAPGANDAVRPRRRSNTSRPLDASRTSAALAAGIASGTASDEEFTSDRRAPTDGMFPLADASLTVSAGRGAVGWSGGISTRTIARPSGSEIHISSRPHGSRRGPRGDRNARLDQPGVLADQVADLQPELDRPGRRTAVGRGFLAPPRHLEQALA